MFKLVLALLPTELADPTRTLIDGFPVRFEDIEIHAQLGPANRVDLTIIRRGSDHKVVVQVDALDGSEPNSDARSALPPPDPWKLESISGGAIWELFNCEVLNVEPRRNLP